MTPLKALSTILLFTLLSVGCQCGTGEGEPDGGDGDGSASADGGRKTDAGVRRDSGYADGGRVWNEFDFSQNTAYEPCTELTLASARDGGLPEAQVYLPLCVALRTVSGNASLNAAPVSAPIEWEWASSGFGSEYVEAPDQTGAYTVKVLRANYTSMKWHPSQLFPTHTGPLETSGINLLDDKMRDVATKSWQLSGALSFGGLPWLPSANPYDTQLGAASPSYVQGASVTNTGGNYQVRLVEGSYAVGVSVPREALGTTELEGYPIGLISLTQDTVLNKDIPVSQLTGKVTLDGQAIPARSATGTDWFMEYEQQGVTTAVSHHEGNDPNIRAVIPRGTYAVNLGFPTGTDRSLPAYLYHRRLASSLDLNQDAIVDYNLPTRQWEGALLVDGQPVPQNAGGVWTLYAYAYDRGANDPWFVSYYDVPFESSAFSLRMFPATYYTQVYIDDRFDPELMAGWYVHDRNLDILTNISSVINIETAEFSGTLLIDGTPASAGLNVGTLILASGNGTYRRKLVTSDGTFKVRVPKGVYDVSFVINEDAYPEYATGRYELMSSVDISDRTTATLVYDTVRVAGPLAVQNEPVPNTSLSLPELSLRLFPSGTAVTWSKKLEGGKRWHSFRVPEGDWDIDVKIEEKALPETAWGVAPYADAYPMRAPK